MLEIVRSAQYDKNHNSVHGNEQPCVICGKPIKDLAQYCVRLFYGLTVVSEAEAAEILAKEGGAGDLGYYPVGVNCLRKHPELKPYVYSEEG